MKTFIQYSLAPLTFSSISGADPSELLENLDEIFPRYYMNDDTKGWNIYCSIISFIIRFPVFCNTVKNLFRYKKGFIMNSHIWKIIIQFQNIRNGSPIFPFQKTRSVFLQFTETTEPVAVNANGEPITELPKEIFSKVRTMINLRYFGEKFHIVISTLNYIFTQYYMHV